MNSPHAAWFSVVKPDDHHLHPLIGFVNDYIDAALEMAQKNTRIYNEFTLRIFKKHDFR